MLVFRFGKYLVPTYFCVKAECIGSEVRTTVACKTLGATFMKHFRFTLIFFFFSVKLFADCKSSGIYFWPQNKTIKSNQIIVIEGYENSQKVIRGLNKQYSIYLKTSNSKVKLKVIETLEGDMNLTQAVLKPEENLVKGLEYQIFISDLPEDEKPLGRWNYETEEYELVKWIVEGDIDTIMPLWLNPPIETKSTLILLGCGPEIYVNFKLKIIEQSDFLIKATVTDLLTNKSTAYYLENDDSSTLKIGHGMCSGPFKFKNEVFEVTFAIMDSSGNFAYYNSNKIRFTNPKSELKER